MYAHRYYLTVTVLLVLAVHSVHAQPRYADTFYVTVADKTPDHPYYGEGYHQGYVVNGLQSPTITLVRDSLYLFDTHEVPSNLVFYFFTIPIGGSQGLYRDHVDEHIISQGLWYVRATDEDPDTLYYASIDQPWMGGTILIVDSIASSVEDGASGRNATSALAAAEVRPNPFAQETELRFMLERRAAVHVQVADALGRAVHRQDAGTLEPGRATVRLHVPDLPPGMYLYRIEAMAGEQRSVASGAMRIVR